MSMRILRPALALLTMLFAGVTLAAEDPISLARDVSVQIYLLENDVAMAMYDESNPAYGKRARATLDAMKAPVNAALQELVKADATTGNACVEAWGAVQGSLLGGGGYGDGLLVTGYDARMHGDYDEGAQRILLALENQLKPAEAASTVESRAYLLAAKTVSTYIKISASPFGSYTNSYNDDSDPVKLVARLDSMLAELAQRHRGNKEKSAKIARVSAKWQFIRTTILKIGKQSTPLIVYKHGGDIVQELKAL